MYKLLEIYESFQNGQKKQFFNQVVAYGLGDFTSGLETSINDGVISYQEAYEMLQSTIMRLPSIEGIS